MEVAILGTYFFWKLNPEQQNKKNRCRAYIRMNIKIKIKMSKTRTADQKMNKKKSVSGPRYETYRKKLRRIKYNQIHHGAEKSDQAWLKLNETEPYFSYSEIINIRF